MTTSAPDKQRIEDVSADDRALTVHLTDGRTLSVPLEWHPRLLDASTEQRNDWRLVGGGVGIHWPQIDEDLSLAGMLRGVRSPALRQDPYLQAVQDFYGQSLGSFKSQIQNYLYQLELLEELLPEGAAKARISEIVDSYMELERFMDQAARDQGVEDSMSQAAEHTQEQMQQLVQEEAQQALEAVYQAQKLSGDRDTD